MGLCAPPQILMSKYLIPSVGLWEVMRVGGTPVIGICPYKRKREIPLAFCVCACAEEAL